MTLLFTLLCVSILNGMKNPERGHYVSLRDISPEIHVIIMHTLNNHNNLDDVINDIKEISLTNKQLNAVVNDIKGFTKIAHILAHTFNSTTDDVAKKFGTPTAKEYIYVTCTLMSAISNCNINEVTQLINDGADVNYSFYPRYYENGATLLTHAFACRANEIIKLLLNSGANPNLKDKFGRNALEWVEEYTGVNKKTKQLLEETIKKQY